MKLLIIGDEEGILDALVYGFKKLGYAVDTAIDEEEGLELSFINEYDLIILDLNLPSIDGVDILEKIRKEMEYKEAMLLVINKKELLVI